MSGHTLGPWKVAPAREGIIDIFDANDHDVVTLYGGRMGNAQLIAAAPELLEALKTAKETIRVWHGPNAWDIYDRASPEMKVINSAISKAEGRS